MDNLTQSIQATPAESDLTSLPPEILRQIVGTHLGIRDRFRAAAVCRTLRRVLDDPTAWADVERIYLGVCHDEHFVNVYGADGDGLGSWILESNSISELLKRSHLKQLDIVEHSPSAIPSLIQDILPFLPSTLEYVRLCVRWFKDDYRPLFQRLAPSLRRLGIKAGSYGQFDLGSPADFTELESIAIEGFWKPNEPQTADHKSWQFLEWMPNLRELRLMPTVPFESNLLSVSVSERDVFDFYCRIASALNERVITNLTLVTELCMDADFVPHIMNGMLFEARCAIEALCVPALPPRLPHHAQDRCYLYCQELVSALPSCLPGLRRLSVWRLPMQDVTTLREAFFAQHKASKDADRRLTIERRGVVAGVTHETRGRVTVTVVNRGRHQCTHNINTLRGNW